MHVQGIAQTDFIWPVGRLCQINRMPFDPALLVQRYPMPHSQQQLLEALKSFGCGQHRGLTKAKIPCIGFLSNEPRPALLARSDGAVKVDSRIRSLKAKHASRMPAIEHEKGMRRAFRRFALCAFVLAGGSLHAAPATITDTGYELGPNKRRELNPFTCRLYERSDLPAAKFRGAVYLVRAEDGWIERVKGGLWTRPINGSPVKFTIPTLVEGSIHPHKFSAFSHKGTLELLTFPPGPWGKGPVEPVRDGFVLRSRNLDVRQQWAPGNAGLYVYLPPNKPKKVAEGVVSAMSVSKNGCQIAFLLDPWDREGRLHRLVAVDVCKAEVTYVAK